MREFETLYLHLGAHKTATTYMQTVLRWNKPMLARGGLCFADKPGRVKFYLSGEKPASFEAVLADLKANRLGQESRLIFSDEDSLLPASISDPVALYADVAPIFDRALTFRKVAGQVCVLFSLRQYDSFISSVYQQEVKRGRVGVDFSTYCADRVDLDRVSWVPLVKALLDRFGNDLVVWDYTEIHRAPETVWGCFGLSPEQIEKLNTPETRSNIALSKLGLDIMRMAYGQIGPKETRELEKFVAKHFRKSAALPAEAHWDDTQSACLAARYRADLDLIGSLVREAGGTFLAAGL